MERNNKGKSVCPSEEAKRRKNKEKWQVDVLEKAYIITERPSAETKIQLAKMTGLTFNQVQFWFGNKRGSKTRFRPKPSQSSRSKLKPGQEPGQSSRSKLKPGQEPGQSSRSKLKPGQEPGQTSGGSDAPQVRRRPEYPVLAPQPISWRPPLDPSGQPYSNTQGQRRCNPVPPARPINWRPPFDPLLMFQSSQEHNQPSSNPQEQPRSYPSPAVPHNNWRSPFDPLSIFQSSQEGSQPSNPQEQPRRYPSPAVQHNNWRPPFDPLLMFKPSQEPDQPSYPQGQQRSYPSLAAQHNNRRPPVGCQQPDQTSTTPQGQRRGRYPGPVGQHNNRRPPVACQTSSNPQGQLRGQYPGPAGQHGDWRAPAGKVEVVLPPLRVNGRTVRNGTMFKYLSHDEYQRLLQINPMGISENQREQEMEQNSQGDDELVAEPEEQPSEKPVICYRRRNRKSTNMALIDLNEPYVEPGMPSSSSQVEQNQVNPPVQSFHEPSIYVPPGFENVYENDIKFRRTRALRYIIRSRERHQNNNNINNNSNIEAPSMEGGGELADKGKQPILLDTDSDSESE